METSVTYRPYVKNDVHQIISLWENDSDFGAITEEIFHKWFLRTPYEDTEIIVAQRSDDKIIGQMIFMPTRVIVDGRVVKAMRVAAPILEKSHRFLEDTEHPIFCMFLKGIERAKKQGFSLLYIFPARGWLRAIEMYSEPVKWHTATYNIFSIEIETNKNEQGADLYFERGVTFTEEYDQLWEEAVNSLPVICGIVRQKDWLSYRLSQHYLIEARSIANKSLRGYVVIKKETGLLLDLLATSKNDVKKVFWGSVDNLASIQLKETVIEKGKITGMYTEMMAFILEGKAVSFPNYKFDFGCCALDDTICAESINAVNWHMTPDV